MTFAKQVRETIAKAEHAAATERSRSFRDVLDDLVAGITDSNVRARLQRGRDPRTWTLYLSPQHRPARVVLMLRFFLDGDSIVISGESSERFREPTELSTWLLEYVQRPAFLETLTALREAAALPVEARLQLDRNRPQPGADILVNVAPAEQRRLDEAHVGSSLEFEVERIDFPGNGRFDHTTAYKTLESAGLLLTVQRVEPAGDKLRVHGTRT